MFCDLVQEWKPRYGYKRTNDETQDWLLEVPQNAGKARTLAMTRVQAVFLYHDLMMCGGLVHVFLLVFLYLIGYIMI